LQVADQLVSATPTSRALTAAAFHELADVPPALTWFANIDNPQTRRAYENDVEELCVTPASLPAGVPGRGAHVLAWRRDLELRTLGDATIRRKLAALSSLFESVCEANVIRLARSTASSGRTMKV
jgi:integrase/recombinase XerD